MFSINGCILFPTTIDIRLFLDRVQLFGFIIKKEIYRYKPVLNYDYAINFRKVNNPNLNAYWTEKEYDEVTKPFFDIMKVLIPLNIIIEIFDSQKYWYSNLNAKFEIYSLYLYIWMYILIISSLWMLNNFFYTHEPFSDLSLQYSCFDNHIYEIILLYTLS